ncbi:hypothetical protein RZS08_07390, partial [Arthrospira platensis SPKY1]|nr:hypothetical protein [Arthrospira platensis SPKY1]
SFHQSNFVDKFMGMKSVKLSDGARVDIAGHGNIESNHVGYARFVPKTNSRYLLSVGRLFYNCNNDYSCSDFVTGNVIPGQVPSSVTRYGNVSMFDNISIVEVSNPGLYPVRLDGSVFNYVLPPQSTRHIDMRALKVNGLTLFELKTNGKVIASVVNYELDNQLSWVVPFGGIYDTQVVEWNTYIDQIVYVDVFNTGIKQTVTLDVFDSEGELIESGNYEDSHYSAVLEKNGSKRFIIEVPKDRYGTVVVKGKQLVVTSSLRKANEYVIVK